MLDKAKVRVLTGRALKSVTKEGARNKNLVIGEGPGKIFTGKVFIDATYEGDLIAAADVSWTIGREGRNEFGDSLAGKQSRRSGCALQNAIGHDEQVPSGTA